MCKTDVSLLLNPLKISLEFWNNLGRLNGRLKYKLHTEVRIPEFANIIQQMMHTDSILIGGKLALCRSRYFPQSENGTQEQGLKNYKRLTGWCMSWNLSTWPFYFKGCLNIS